MKVTIPRQDVPVVLGSGLMNPVWYEFFGNLLKRGVLDMPDVNNSTPIANNQVLIWNSTTKKFTPGLN